MENNQGIWLIIRRMRMPFLVIIITFAISILGMTLIPGMDDKGHPYHLSFFDAFYFVSYMASTIGFGEAPYTFTYPQRLWVSFCIYLTVIGWFYGIGTIVALVQDKQLSRELAFASFRKKIGRMREPFIIILGYNSVTRQLIYWLNRKGIRVVVVDKSSEKIEELELENFSPEVPAFSADVTQPEILKMSGILKKNCKAVVALFEDDLKNTRIALIARLLNKQTDIIVKSTTKAQTEHLHNLGIRFVEDPFVFISNRFYLALTSPSLWVLEMWVFGHILKIRKREILPRGKYIIVGYGRMGRALEKALIRADIPYSFIDIKSDNYKRRKKSAIFGDSEDYQILKEAGIEEATGIIAATKDDMINLTILMTAKKLNENIFTIGRENTLDDISIFRTARIDRIYILDHILSNFTYNFIAKPLTNIFVRLLHKQSEEWGNELVEMLHKKIDENPKLFEVTLNEDECYALYNRIKTGEKIRLGVLKRSRGNWREEMKLLFLLLRHNNEISLIPNDDIVLELGMQLLVASNSESREDFETIVNNYYELHYVLTGTEQHPGIVGKLFPVDKKD